jgi:predicted exporter
LKADPIALWRRPALWVWLLFVLAATGVAIRANYVADLSAFLPSTPSAEQRVLLEQLRSGEASRVLLIGIRGRSSEARAARSRALATTLRASPLFEAVHNGDETENTAGGTFLFDHRYLLSPAVDAEHFRPGGLRDAIDDTVGLLGTPAGALIKGILWRDPTGETVRVAEALLPAQAPRSENGVWVSRSEPRALLVATTRADGYDLDRQAQAIAAVEQGFAATGGQAPEAGGPLSLEVSGLGVFSVQARARIRNEVERLATAGSVAIIVLLFVVFGQPRSLVIAAAPVATGVIAGIAAVSLRFGSVHGVTLGFGTTLIGESVDYAIYYLIQARPRAGAAAVPGTGNLRWIRDNWPTVRLGLLTSLAGFSALLLSGFSGLSQLGVYSVAGLIAAAATTRYVLPLLAPDGAPGLGLRRPLGRATAAVAGRLRAVRWPLLALTAAAAILILVRPNAWSANLSSLSPVPASAIALDASLRADLGAAETGTLVAVQAADEPGVLARAEAAATRLDGLIGHGLASYTSPAMLLPSPATQRARQAALPDEAALREALAQATAGGPLPAAKLEPFVRDVQAARTAPLVTAADYAGTPFSSVLQAQLLPPGRGGGPWTALISLQMTSDTSVADNSMGRDDLRAALAGLAETRVVAVEVELNAIYARYLRQAQWQAGAGALIVVILLAFYLRSGQRLLLVLLPLAAAEILVLAALAFFGVHLGVLHLVGLLLVVAVGSNYALFFDHLREVGDRDEETLASLAIANLTTVISFGLLATSTVPALAAVGQVVAPGAALALVLSAALIGPRGTPVPAVQA